MIFSCRSGAAMGCRVLLLLASLGLPTAGAAKPRPHPTRPRAASDAAAYRGAIVIDAATGRVLFEDRADEVSPPASMTKLMTFAVLADKLSTGQLALATPVKIDGSDARIGGTQVFLDPRETFPVEELIYAMMIQSANDAAHALARVAAGSVPAFVELMNAKAREIGMTHTRFRSPHGLPPSSRRLADGDLTTPRDYAVLCRYLLLHTDVLKYTSVRHRDFAPNRRNGPMHMDNHNKLLGKVAGVDGLKTGYTEGAGYCLSATAERNGQRVIVVVMGSFGPGGQRDLGRTRDLKSVELLERGFAALGSGKGNFTRAAGPGAKPAIIDIEAGVPADSTPPAVHGASRPLPASSAGAAAMPDGPTVKFSLPLK